jgi:transaldolase
MGAQATAPLQAAAGEVEITPAGTAWLSGFSGRTVPAAGVHDPVMARALLLHDGATPLLLVVCDLIGFAPAAVAALRGRIEARSGIPAAHILVACTHTHSGPASMPLRGVLGRVDDVWLAEALARIVDLAVELPRELRTARLARAELPVAGIGYNRQDGSQPTDEMLHVLAVEDADGAAIATLLHYATHAVVLGPANLQVSADFPGAAAREIARRRGGVGLYLQGTCGDVDPLINREHGWGTGTFADCEEIGARLVQAAQGALASAAWASEVRIRVGTRRVAVPLDPPPAPTLLATLVAGYHAERERPTSAVGAEEAAAMLTWADELARAQAEGRLPRVLSAEIWVAGLGELCLVGLPFEVYTGIGRCIGGALAPCPAWVIGYANGLYGYCPTRAAHDQGGYGPGTSHRWFPELLTPIAAGAEEALARAAHPPQRCQSPMLCQTFWKRSDMEDNYLHWLVRETQTRWWHDSARSDELNRGLGWGASGATTNPVLVSQALIWQGEHAVALPPDPDGDRQAEEFTRIIVQDTARALQPVYERTAGRDGYVCAQVNPVKAGHAQTMIDMARRFHVWAPNIAVKLPATAAGMEALEECAALGITVTATVSFTVPQVIAIAEAYRRGMARARQAGLALGRCFAVIMIGRVDDYLRDVAQDGRAGVDEADIRQAGLAIVKRAYGIFQERRYEAILLVAALRGAYHMVELAGADLVMSIHPTIQNRLVEPGVPRETRIGVPVAPGTIARLRTLPEFVRAYEPDGMAPAEFLAFGLTQRTLAAFVEGGWNKLRSFGRG